MTVAAVPTAPTAPVGEQITKRRLWFILGALLLGMLLAALDSTIVSTALPTIVGDLHGGSHLAWVVTAYLLASTVSTPEAESAVTALLAAHTTPAPSSQTNTAGYPNERRRWPRNSTAPGRNMWPRPIEG